MTRDRRHAHDDTPHAADETRGNTETATEEDDGKDTAEREGLDWWYGYHTNPKLACYVDNIGDDLPPLDLDDPQTRKEVNDFLEEHPEHVCVFFPPGPQHGHAPGLSREYAMAHVRLRLASRDGARAKAPDLVAGAWPHLAPLAHTAADSLDADAAHAARLALERADPDVPPTHDGARARVYTLWAVACMRFADALENLADEKERTPQEQQMVALLNVAAAARAALADAEGPGPRERDAIALLDPHLARAFQPQPAQAEDRKVWKRVTAKDPYRPSAITSARLRDAATLERLTTTCLRALTEDASLEEVAQCLDDTARALSLRARRVPRPPRAHDARALHEQLAQREDAVHAREALAVLADQLESLEDATADATPPPCPKPRPTGVRLGFLLPESPPPGFRAGSATRTATAVTLERENHVFTFGATGSGKSTRCVIPAVLSHPGSLIVIDPKGEVHEATHRYRRAIGDTVWRINPDDPHSDGLDPLDLVDAANLTSAARHLAHHLAPPRGHLASRDPFWEDTALHIVTGLIAHYVIDRAAEKVSLIDVGQLATWPAHLSEGPMRRIAAASCASFAREHVPSYYDAKASTDGTSLTAASIRLSVRHLAGWLTDPGYRRVFARTTVDLDRIHRGERFTLYLTIGSHRAHSEQAFTRLLVASLLAKMFTRVTPPEHPTLFLLDEAAQMGNLEAVNQTMHVGRSYGIQLWTLWQSATQCATHYPDWEGLVANAHVVQSLDDPERLRAMNQHGPEAVLSRMVGFTADQKAGHARCRIRGKSEDMPDTTHTMRLPRYDEPEAGLEGRFEHPRNIAHLKARERAAKNDVERR